MKDIWLRILIGSLITLMLAGFSSQEVRKVDRSEFTMYKQYHDQKIQDIKDSLEAIKIQLGKLNERMNYGKRMAPDSSH